MSLSAAAQEPLAWAQLPSLPIPLGVAAPFAGSSGGALLVAGGAYFPEKMPWEGGAKMWIDAAWVLTEPGGIWFAAGNLPRPLAYGVSVTHKDTIICVGGSDSKQHYADAFRLKWEGGTLKTEALPPLPIALAGAAGALSRDTLVVAGGAEQPGEQAASNRAFSIDLSAAVPAWKELPVIPGKGRIFPVAAADDESFYLFGGAALIPGQGGKVERIYLREAWSYRPAAGWVQLSHLPKPCVAGPSPAPVVQGRILLLGGDDGSLARFQPIQKHPGFPRTILAYYPTRDEWTTEGAVAASRATVPVVQWQKSFVIPSGEMRPGVRSPEVWSFPFQP